MYGPAAIGVILTGNLDDGTAGLGTIKQLGGQAIVQDPDDAQCPSMPSSALSAVEANHVVPLDHIAPLLSALVAGATLAAGGTPAPGHLDLEVRIAKGENPEDDALGQRRRD